jgi:hypothetical protein
MEPGNSARRWRPDFGDQHGCRAMQTPAQYRKYAEECERIAREGLAKNSEVLLEIARAWRNCADELERKQEAKRREGWDKLITP